MSAECKIINLNGENGVGRCNMVQELARFLTMRNSFKNGVYYHNFDKAQNMTDADVFFKGTIAQDLDQAEILLILDNIDNIEK